MSKWISWSGFGGRYFQCPNCHFTYQQVFTEVTKDDQSLVFGLYKCPKCGLTMWGE